METDQKQETGLVLTSNKLLSLDKASLTEFAQAVTDKYLDGFSNPAEGKLLAKKMGDFAELVSSNLSDAAASELKLAKGEKREFMGATVTEQMLGTRYSFKECGDPIWNELTEKIKKREDFLKTINGSQQVLIEETGEVVQIFEPVKSGKLGLVFKY